jgi:hypothetical protein
MKYPYNCIEWHKSVGKVKRIGYYFNITSSSQKKIALKIAPTTNKLRARDNPKHPASLDVGAKKAVLGKSFQKVLFYHGTPTGTRAG